MARIPEDTINRIHDAADILDVVSGYVQLKRWGRNWFGLLILFAISPLVTALRPGGVLSIDYWPIWIALASAFWLVNDVVNIGLERNFGWRPRFGLVGFLALGLYLVCNRMDG